MFIDAKRLNLHAVNRFVFLGAYRIRIMKNESTRESQFSTDYSDLHIFFKSDNQTIKNKESSQIYRKQVFGADSRINKKTEALYD